MLGGSGPLGTSYHTVSMNISDGRSSLSGLDSTNDTLKAQREQISAQVGTNVKIPETQVATRTEIGGILDIRG